IRGSARSRPERPTFEDGNWKIAEQGGNFDGWLADCDLLAGEDVGGGEAFTGGPDDDGAVPDIARQNMADRNVCPTLGADQFLHEARDGGHELDSPAFGAAPRKGDDMVRKRAEDFQRNVLALRPKMGQAAADLAQA